MTGKKIGRISYRIEIVLFRFLHFRILLDLPVLFSVYIQTIKEFAQNFFARHWIKFNNFYLTK